MCILIHGVNPRTLPYYPFQLLDNLCLIPRRHLLHMTDIKLYLTQPIDPTYYKVIHRLAHFWI